MVIPPIYSRAWTFSEGIAAVEKDGRLVFIDRSGSVVIDKGLEAMGEFPDYRFQNSKGLVFLSATRNHNKQSGEKD